MNTETLLTVAGSVIAVIGSNIALIGWLRSDMKTFETEISTDMKTFKSEMRSNMKSFEKEVRGWRNDLARDSKDFHGRLCTIEQKTKSHGKYKNGKKK